jgi:glycine betaine transporter
MNDREFPGTLLVAIDFSPSSLRALDAALAWRRPGSDVIAVHVVDVDLAARLEGVGVCGRADGIARMRERAESAMATLRAEREGVELDSMIVEGIPFLEIVKLSKDLACDAIVVGTRGGSPTVRDLVFGSTAQRVLLAAEVPILCVP